MTFMFARQILNGFAIRFSDFVIVMGRPKYILSARFLVKEDTSRNKKNNLFFYFAHRKTRKRGGTLKVAIQNDQQVSLKHVSVVMNSSL